MLSLIAAVAEENAIGRDNGLLWHLPEDLKYFKRTTLGHPVIMGRKTFESIGRPLPGRRNIVLTRQAVAIPGAEVFHSAESVFREAEDSGQEFFVIGGGELYRQMFDRADRLYITHIRAKADDADVFFPRIDPEKWHKREESEPMTDPASGIGYRFAVYERSGNK